MNGVNFVRVVELMDNDNLLSDFLKEHFIELDETDLGKKIQIIDRIVANDFSKKVEKNESFEYNFTIAWAQLCFEMNNANCLVYPSVLSDMSTSNWAFKPKYAYELLFPCDVERAFIDKISPDGRDIDLITTYKADLNGHGNINWYEIKPRHEKITHRRVSENPFKLIPQK